MIYARSVLLALEGAWSFFRSSSARLENLFFWYRSGSARLKNFFARLAQAQKIYAHTQHYHKYRYSQSKKFKITHIRRKQMWISEHNVKPTKSSDNPHDQQKIFDQIQLW